MAIITTIFNKLHQLFSTYVLGGSANWMNLNRKYIYFMPILYLSVFSIAASLIYFIWKKYQHDLQHAMPSSSSAMQAHSKLPPYTWLNRFFNWTFMTDPHLKQPECIRRWVEDLNISIVKQKAELSVLLYDLCEESYPPRVKDIGMVTHTSDGVMEIPVLLESCQFGFQLSVQEHIDGKIVASSYEANVTKFFCMINVNVSREDGNVIAKFLPDLKYPKNEFRIKLTAVSKQRIVSTIPETVANIIKHAVLTTPFQLNVSSWGGVFSQSKISSKSVSVQKNVPPQKPDGDTKPAKPQNNKEIPKPKTSSPKREKKEKTQAKNKIEKSLERPKNVTNVIVQKNVPEPTKLPASAFLEQSFPSHIRDQGLSGSLGSLVNVKRSYSGRGPAKPIRAKEKQIIFKEISVDLKGNGVERMVGDLLYMTIELDLPFQKLTTKSKSTQSLKWNQKNLIFDLSSRSMEIKFTMFCSNENKQPSSLTRGVFKLEGVDVHNPGEFTIPLQNNDGLIKLKIEFSEADAKQKAKDRRSLDLSTLSRYQPPNFEQTVEEITQKATNIESSALIQTPAENLSSTKTDAEQPESKQPIHEEGNKSSGNINYDEASETTATTTFNENTPTTPRERAQTEANNSPYTPQLRNNLKPDNKVRRTRSLIFGKGKKKEMHSQSAVDLSNYHNGSDGTVNDDEIAVPENTLQRNAKSKKKISRSVSKLVSKIARKSSVKKKKPEANAEEKVKEVGSLNQSSNNGNGLLTASPAKSDTSSSTYPDSIDSSFTDSPNNSAKRNKSFRHRLFGAKRKTNKN